MSKSDNYGRSSGNAGRSASGSSFGGRSRCSRTGGSGQAGSQIDGPESNAFAATAEGISGAEESREGSTTEGDESGEEGVTG